LVKLKTTLTDRELLSGEKDAFFADYAEAHLKLSELG
jgi:hypothetical protein